MNKIKGSIVKRFIILSSLIALYYVFLHGNTRQVAYAQTCTVPSQVPNVAITFPSCTGNNCDFTQGSCSWGAVTGATGYQVTITEVETNRSVQSQQVASSVTTNTFPVSESNTYRCDVAASNACGNGAIGTAALLCKVDAAVTTTPAPTTPPAVPTATPAPRMLVTGSDTPLLVLTSSAFIVLAVGVMFLII